MRLTGFQLKMLAMILMVCDHVYQYIPNSPIWLTYVERIPLFNWLLGRYNAVCVRAQFIILTIKKIISS